MPSPTLRPLGIGEILDGTFTIYRHHFAALLAVVAVCALPGALLDLVDRRFGLALGMIHGVVATVPLVWMSSEVILGRVPSVAEAFRVALRRALPALWVTLRVWVLVLLATALVGGAAALLVGFVVRPVLGESVGPVGVFFGVVIVGTAIAAPAALLSIRWFATEVVVVLEPGTAPLGRSGALARGSYARLGAVLSIAWLIGSLPLFALGLGQGAARVLLEDTWGSTAALATSALIGWVSSVLWTPFMAALQTVMYYDQRVRTEGFDVQLAMAAIAPLETVKTPSTGAP